MSILNGFKQEVRSELPETRFKMSVLDTVLYQYFHSWNQYQSHLFYFNAHFRTLEDNEALKLR